jgi:hypothetical protein
MVEPIFNTVPGVRRTALVGVARGGAMYPVLCVELEAFDFSRDVKYRLRSWEDWTEEFSEVAQRYKHTRTLTTFLEPPEFPVDVRHNSKIFREKLAIWADKKLGKNWNPQAKARGSRAVGAEAGA